jgi:hypothetical protein
MDPSMMNHLFNTFMAATPDQKVQIFQGLMQAFASPQPSKVEIQVRSPLELI